MGHGLLYIKKIVYYVQLEPWRKGKRPVQSLSDDIGFLLLATVILQALTQMTGLQVSAEFRYQGRVLVSK